MDTSQLSYAGGYLNRAGNLRKNSEWVNSQLLNSETLIIPVWKSHNLITYSDNSASTPKAVQCKGKIAEVIINSTSTIVFLGLDNGTAIFAADLSEYKEKEAISLIGEGKFIDLRKVGPLLKKEEATLMAYARGILYSHINYRYCGKCGHVTESREGGHMRLCTNPDCNNEIFPRTDPAVIMLVEYIPQNGEPPKCLLGSNAKWPKGFYSTLAGFVETGESLEEAVIREVDEEVGVKIGSVKYQTSQPWPFPSSIMLGFRAQAITTEITVDKNEIREARWFTVEELLECGEWGDNSSKYHLSRKDSISRFLIDTWIEENR